MEEHAHTDACYEWTDVLTCQLPEGADGHTHTDACYEVNTVLSCGKLELHTHTDECYEKINEEEELSETNRRLICTIPVLEEHVHTEEAGCFEIVEVTANGELVEEGVPNTENEDEKEIFTTDLDGEDGEDEEAEIEEKNEGEEIYDKTQSYEGEGYVVTASYNDDASIPEEAEFIAKQITEENDEENYKKHEAEFKKSVKNEDSTMSALFEIGFYVDGEEVEPASPVEITIQLIDKNGLPEGTPIKIVHFGDEKTEVISGSKVKSGSTSFKTDSFSPFAVGFNNEEAEAAKVFVHISESATYEDDVFKAVFVIEGDIKVAKSGDTSLDDENDDRGNDEESTLDRTSPENGTASDEMKAETDETRNDADNVDASTGEVSTENDDEEIKFEVEALDKDSEKYTAVMKHMGKSDDIDDMLRLQVLSCSLTYNGEEVDISDCKVTARIGTTQSLNENVQESVPETVKQLIEEDESIDELANETLKDKTEITVKAMSVKGTRVNVLGNISAKETEVDEPIEYEFDASEEDIAIAEEAAANPSFSVQYYAYAQIMEDKQTSGTEAIAIINTNQSEGVGGAVLPRNGTTFATKNMYVKNTGESIDYGEGTGNDKRYWEIYEPVYKSRELNEEETEALTTDSLTKLYTTDTYEFKEVAGGLNHINKFAKDGMNFNLFEVWVLEDETKVNETSKDGWKIYSGNTIKNLQFTNNETVDKEARAITATKVLMLFMR